MFAARELVGGRSVTVVGAVLGQPLTPTQPSVLEAAFHATTALLESASHVLERFQLVRRGSAIAWLKAPWARTVAVRPVEAVSFVGWPGLPIRARIVPVRELRAPLRYGQKVGVVVATAGRQHAEVSLGASAALTRPSLAWRLAHP